MAYGGDKRPNYAPATKFANELDYQELKVAGQTAPKELAGSIFCYLEQGKTVALAAIGHQAVGQALKSVPILNGLTIAHGYVMTVLPWFDVKLVANDLGPNVERTAIMLHLVKTRPI